MKYSIEVEIPDERWHSTSQETKSALFESILAPEIPSSEGDRITLTLKTLAGAPFGFYHDDDDNLWYVDSHGAYYDGDSYSTSWEFLPNYGPFTYLGINRPSE